MLGERGPLDLGIPDNYSVAEAKRNRRRRNHRVDILNQVEEEISKLGNHQDEDMALWKLSAGNYRANFSTSKTWDQLREKKPTCDWHKGVWFSQSTPKYAFMMWITLRGRLQTMDKMRQWNNSVNPVCVLCDEASESCAHLFFECKYSERVWRNLVEGLMQGGYTAVLRELVEIVSKPWLTPIKTFILRYALQATMHTVWWERNARKHGERPRDLDSLTKLVDKNIRLKLLAVKGRGNFYTEGLITWFGTRA
ncbi:uncharacterized protein LOC108824512 [Raphanus sativus]|uniref:Uncharacterized protein LOC108824512 n=1 Tax=Raphanus sativus TaxID=3726 RepID=A0A6J0L1Y6_RAPSA|nr:uncharacterized protein LOC108824512 [Raphanus sativus]